MRSGSAYYRCAAGVTHYDRPSLVERWKRDDQQRVAGEVAAKVKAHDDYMDAMAKFREQIALRKAAWLNNLRTQYQVGVEEGYLMAIKDMERALMDAVRGRHDEEEE